MPYLSDNYQGCYIHKEIYGDEISAIIVSKYVDYDNHGEQTIAYVENGKSERKMVFPGYLIDLYDYSNVGDSIVKRKNSIDYRIKSKIDGKDSIFTFESFCKDSIAIKRKKNSIN